MIEIRKQKTKIRESYIEKRRSLSIEEKKDLDNQVCERVIASSTYKNANVILAYMPKEDELDITSVLEKALLDGKKLALPNCDPETKNMDFYFVNSLSELSEGHYSILEPNTDNEMYDYENYKDKNIICIVPAIVYDRKGFRIGYGGGYYDRYLSTFKGLKVGVAYFNHIISEVPKGKFDFAVDVLISERGVYAKR